MTVDISYGLDTSEGKVVGANSQNRRLLVMFCEIARPKAKCTQIAVWNVGESSEQSIIWVLAKSFLVTEVL